MLHIPDEAHIPVSKYAIERIKQLPLIAVAYLVISYFFNIEVSVILLSLELSVEFDYVVFCFSCAVC